MRHGRPRRPSQLWLALTQAPYLPIAAYLGLVGLVGLVSGEGVAPDTLVAVLPRWLVLAWTVAIAAGGIFATGGGLTQHTRVESSGLGFLAFGATLYGVVVTKAAWPYGLTVIAVSAAVLSMCLIRMRVLSLARHAQEVAQHITDEDGEGI